MTPMHMPATITVTDVQKIPTLTHPAHTQLVGTNQPTQTI